MNVLIVGAGAVGSVLAARLKTAGHAVTVVARPEIVRAITRKGLVVTGVGPGTYRVQAEREVPSAPSFDVAVVATKTFDLAAAARNLAERRSPLPTLLIQNGLGVEETALLALRAGGWATAEQWVVRVVQSIPATFVAPGEVRCAGPGEVVLPNPESAGPAGPAVRTVRALFEGGPLPVRTTSDLPREVWKKLLVNAAINPVTAIHHVPNGALLEGPLRAEAGALLDEARAVAEREGTRFSPAESVEEFERVVRATAENRSSMLQDVERGRPTEVDAILGEIVRRGDASGVRVPASRAALGVIHSLVRREHPRNEP